MAQHETTSRPTSCYIFTAMRYIVLFQKIRERISQFKFYINTECVDDLIVELLTWESFGRTKFKVMKSPACLKNEDQCCEKIKGTINIEGKIHLGCGSATQCKLGVNFLFNSFLIFWQSSFSTLSDKISTSLKMFLVS